MTATNMENELCGIGFTPEHALRLVRGPLEFYNVSGLRTTGSPAHISKVTVTAMTTSATITTAAIFGGLISANQGAAGAATYTMPTGSVFAAAFTAATGLTPSVGDAVEFSICNISTVAAEDVTVAGATGMTARGNMTVASNAAVTDRSAATFVIINTGTNTFDFYKRA